MKSLSTRRRHPLAAFVVLALGLAFAGALFAAFVSPSANADTGETAAQQLHAKTAVVVYSDFPPGKDSLEAFRMAFEAAGGKVIDAIPAGRRALSSRPLPRKSPPSPLRRSIAGRTGELCTA